jgi:hypothetical protein
MNHRLGKAVTVPYVAVPPVVSGIIGLRAEDARPQDTVSVHYPFLVSGAGCRNECWAGEWAGMLSVYRYADAQWLLD